MISYSVNEQVAGQFQVLLASSIAKRIGLHGAPATDMPAGSVPSIVIGKAILVTTKGGRGAIKIQFGKKTAAKLRKLRRVTLTIRLVVRNASSRTPALNDGDQHRHLLALTLAYSPAGGARRSLPAAASPPASAMRTARCARRCRTTCRRRP